MKSGVSSAADCWEAGGGSSFKSTERSVALRVSGLTTAAELCSAIADESWGSSTCIREGRGREEETGELRTASRTGSKAGMAPVTIFDGYKTDGDSLSTFL